MKEYGCVCECPPIKMESGEDMTVRMLRGRYFWPTRTKDVALYTKSCDACQHFGPLRSTSRELRTILNIQPMDMLGIDFVGPINLMSRAGNKYILLAVDYFSRYMFAEATEQANGQTVVNFVRKIATVLGWPVSIYCDNASYFVKGVFPSELKERGVHLFTAPVTHPSSVGLAEKYVNLTLTALRTILRGPQTGELRVGQETFTAELPLKLWSECLSSAVFAINNRIVRTHGFTPSQLLFGISPRGHPEDFTVRDEWMLQSGLMDVTMAEWVKEGIHVGWDGQGMKLKENEDTSVWVYLNQREEDRYEAVESIMKTQQQMEEEYRRRKKGGEEKELKEGDLVLLRRAVVDKDKGRKLEPRWEGPYAVVKVGFSNVSVNLKDFHTDKTRGRHSLDAVKLYVRREEGEESNTVDLRCVPHDVSRVLEL